MIRRTILVYHLFQEKLWVSPFNFLKKTKKDNPNKSIPLLTYWKQKKNIFECKFPKLMSKLFRLPSNTWGVWIAEAWPGLPQTFKMLGFTKLSILDVCGGPSYATEQVSMNLALLLHWWQWFVLVCYYIDIMYEPG